MSPDFSFPSLFGAHPSFGVVDVVVSDTVAGVVDLIGVGGVTVVSGTAVDCSSLGSSSGSVFEEEEPFEFDKYRFPPTANNFYNWY